MSATRKRRFVVTSLVVAEVCYWLGKDVGADVEARFLAHLAEDPQFELFMPDNADLHRMSELVRKYKNIELGGSDASVVVASERLQTPDVATIDRRDFVCVRPLHVDYLTLHPLDLPPRN